jgi:hypothetical protein
MKIMPPQSSLAVIEALEAATSVNRRVAQRHPAAGKVSCHPACGRNGELWSGTLRDISRTGIGLLLPRRWEKGTILLLKLDAIRGGGPRTLCACVMHSTPHPEEGFVVGCSHGGELSEDEIQAFAEENELPQ